MNNACEGTEIAISSNVALLSDIHGNAPALQAVLEDIHHEHCTRVFMLGDLINGIDPHGCVHILRTWSEVKDVHLCCVKGNAEAYLTTPDRDALPRQNETRNKQLMRLIQWFHDHLEAGDVAWIQSFPDTMRWNDAYFVHDSPSDRVAVHTQHPDILPQYREWFYHGRGIHSKMADNEWRELLEYMDSEHLNYMFSGHTHRPFCHKIGTKVICNVGSAGAPVDGDPRASWVLVTKEASGHQRLSIRRVTYDVSLQLQRIDHTPDYKDFHQPEIRDAYKQWFITGLHWKMHLSGNES